MLGGESVSDFMPETIAATIGFTSILQQHLNGSYTESTPNKSQEPLDNSCFTCNYIFFTSNAYVAQLSQVKQKAFLHVVMCPFKQGKSFLEDSDGFSSFRCRKRTRNLQCKSKIRSR